MPGTGSAPLAQAPGGGLAGVGEQVVGLAEGLALDDEVARDLVALQRALARHVIQLQPDAQPHLLIVPECQSLCVASIAG